MSKHPSSPRFPNEVRLRLLRSHTAEVGLGWMTPTQGHRLSDAATLINMYQLSLRGPRSLATSPQNTPGTSNSQRRWPHPVLSSSRTGAFLLRSAAWCQYKKSSSSNWDEHQTSIHSYIKASHRRTPHPRHSLVISFISHAHQEDHYSGVHWCCCRSAGMCSPPASV